MGRKTRQREDQQRQRTASAESALRQRTPALLQRPEYVKEFAHFPQKMRERVTNLHEHYVHAPDTWVPRVKSKDGLRRFIDAVEYIFFQRYEVPQHLIRSWVSEDQQIPMQRHALLCPNWRHWYVIAARGGSLYKEVARSFLSKQELHYFLNAPLRNSNEAYWYAIARPHAADARHALWVAMSRISMKVILPIGESPWPDVARYFARNPTNFREISDLCDYIHHEMEEGRAPLNHPLEANRQAFSLKGRTLPVLRRRTEEWHRALRKRNSIGGGSWQGVSIKDIDYTAGGKDKRALWRFRQITTGDGLFKEGQRMHHCVAGYKHRCMRGECSIWSLTYEFPLGVQHRGVTIEVNKNNVIVQVRGYANRAILPNEAAMIRTWAAEHKLAWYGRG